MEGLFELRVDVLFRAALLLLVSFLSVHPGILPQVLAIPDAPNHLLTNDCTTANYEYNTYDGPGSFFYYTGIPDSYCDGKGVLLVATQSLFRFGVCGVTGAPACTTAIAPYSTKTDACKAKGNGATKCLNSLRVLYNNYDLDCDLVVVCEYFDGPATTVNTATPGTPPAAITPTAVLPPSPSLLPKAGDLVLLSAYAVGAVQYTCNRASGLFANITVIANLYTNPPQNGTIGIYLSANETQVYSLTDGGKAQIGASDKGASYAQNSTVLSDGGYGSLNRSFSTATGNLSLANVTYIAITGTVGGVLPNKAVCSKAAGTLALIPSFPWTVPYEANVTFYSKFTPPV